MPADRQSLSSSRRVSRVDCKFLDSKSVEKVCSERYVSRVQAMVRCCGGLVATQWCRCLRYSWPLRLRTRINSPLELRSGRVMARWTRLLEAVAAVQLPGPTGASFTSNKKLACGAPGTSMPATVLRPVPTRGPKPSEQLALYRHTQERNPRRSHPPRPRAG